MLALLALTLTVRVVELRLPFDGQDFTSVRFTVNEAAGDALVISTEGKGVIRLDHEDGITIFPPTYKLASVTEKEIAASPSEPHHGPQSCTLTYLNDDPDYAPKKMLHSSMNCATLMKSVPNDAIFAGEIPR